MKDQVLLYNDYSMLKMRCYSCHSNSHLIDQCHMIHMKCDKERVIKQEYFPRINQRERSLKPRNRKNYSALLQFRFTAIKAKEFQAEYYLMDRSRLSGTEVEDLSQHSQIGMIQEQYDDDDSKCITF